MTVDDESIELLQAPGDEDGAARTFDRIEEELRSARDSAEAHVYVWRSDEIGNRIGRAVLAAADRGVRVHLIKDMGAFMYERCEMNRKSLFDVRLPFAKRCLQAAIRPTFPDTFVEDGHDGAVGEALMNHPNVDLQWINKTHTKYWVFDERRLILGSINLEDRHRGYYDYAVGFSEPQVVRRFRDRISGSVRTPDSARPVEFLINQPRQNGRERFEIKPAILEHLARANTSVDVEMAYLGDPDVTAGLIHAARRGVQVRMLVSREANIGNDLNYRTISVIFDAAPVEVRLATRMIHSKMMMFDRRVVLLGSANLSVFSLQKAGEASIIARGAGNLSTAVSRVFDRRWSDGAPVTEAGQLRTFNRVLAALQQWHQKINPN